MGPPSATAYPVAGNFLSLTAKSLQTNQPILFDSSYILNPDGLCLTDGVVTIKSAGIYLIQFGITPEIGACPGDEVFISIGPGLRIAASLRNLSENHIPVNGSFTAGFHEGEVLCLSISSSSPILLADSSPCVNAYLVLAQLGGLRQPELPASNI